MNSKNDLAKAIADSVMNALKANADFDNDGGSQLNFYKYVNRGVCAGSVATRWKPQGTVGIDEVLAAMKDILDQDTITISSSEDARDFFDILLNCCKGFVNEGFRVDIIGKLAFEARNYQNPDEGCYMIPLPVDRAFNKLDNPVKFDIGKRTLAKKIAAAKKEPFDDPANDPFCVEKVGQMTFVTCPECGTRIKIAESREVA